MKYTAVLSAFGLFALGFVSASASARCPSHKKPAKPQSPCTKELAQIVYYPNLPAFQYLARLKDEFSQIAEQALTQYEIGLTQTPFQAQGPIADFVKKYNVVMTVMNPFGVGARLQAVGGVVVNTRSPLIQSYWHSLSQASVLGYSYGTDTDLGVYAVTFILTSEDTAEETTIVIETSMSSFTALPCNN